MALKAAADVNQEATNLNLVVKDITDVKKSVKATDVKPLKSTLTKSVDWPNFRTIKMVQLFANFQWAELLKSWLSVVGRNRFTGYKTMTMPFQNFFRYSSFKTQILNGLYYITYCTYMERSIWRSGPEYMQLATFALFLC